MSPTTPTADTVDLHVAVVEVGPGLDYETKTSYMDGGGADIEDETSDTYTPVAGDVGVGGTLEATATYRDGSLTAAAPAITLRSSALLSSPTRTTRRRCSRTSDDEGRSADGPGADSR